MEKTLTELILEQRSYLKNTFPKKKAEDFVDALYRLLFNLDSITCESSYEIEQRLRGKRLELSEIVYDYLKETEITEQQTKQFFTSITQIYPLLLCDARAIQGMTPPLRTWRRYICPTQGSMLLPFIGLLISCGNKD